MKSVLRLASAAALLWLSQIVGVLAMTQAQMPTKIPIPWGNSAGSAYIRTIPQTSQIGIQNCAASWPDGFPPLTFVPSSSGGCPPFGQDMNGVLAAISQWSRFMQAYSGLPYDATFSTAVGGYPKGAVVQSGLVQGRLWYNTTDNNTTTPDAISGSSGWTVLPGTYAPGTPIPVYSTTSPPPNAVPADGLTVGNASSNATSRANIDTAFLFAFLWNNCINCTLFNSSGGVVSKGATALADFNANRAIATIQMMGRGLIGADSIGGSSTTFLTGVPVTVGGRVIPSSVLGENLHQLTVSELATHTHANSLTDPGHIHANSLTDPGHTHTNSLTDPGHNHTQSFANQANLNLAAGGNAVPTQVNLGPSGTSVTGITINNASATTGITINNASSTTGITLTNANQGGNVAHNTVELSTVVWWYLSL